MAYKSSYGICHCCFSPTHYSPASPAFFPVLEHQSLPLGLCACCKLPEMLLARPLVISALSTPAKAGPLPAKHNITLQFILYTELKRYLKSPYVFTH